MPPHHKPHRHPHPGRPGAPIPASRALQFIERDRIEAALQAFIPEASDRGFVLRCILDEGPIHHRGANYVLISLLHKLTQPAGPEHGRASASESVTVPMRLPPHLAEDIVDADYPLRLATGALSDLVAGDAARLEAVIDCLTDGPVQHALANVLMVNLLDRLLSAPSPPKR